MNMMTNAESKKRILVVDDVAFNIKTVSEILMPIYDISFATNGKKAIEIASNNNPPDLILLDVMMPEMDGYEVCQRLKSDEKTKDIPIIFLTAKTQVEDEKKGLELGAVDYIMKPISPPIIIARVETHLRLRQINLQLMEEIKVRTKVQERLQEELNEASNYVRALLPAPSTENNICVDWRFLPSSELGGDSFGYHWIDRDHLAIYLVDVAGHGVGAALLSVAVINHLRSHALPITDFHEPSQVLNALNLVFSAETQNDMFFTIWYGVYKANTNEIVYSSGGHPPALLISEDPGKRFQIEHLITPNLAIGALSGHQFQQKLYKINGPSRLYIFSDGVYEITKEDGSIWEIDGFSNLLLSLTEQKETQYLDQLLQNAKRLNAKPEFDDDYTMLEVLFK
jgi:phosphoserine phosphatase RsbU/P